MMGPTGHQMIDEALASRSFSRDDQMAFARRTQVGAPVVHGIHHLAWAADAVLHFFPLKVANIRARFLQPLYIDETAHVRILQRTDSQIKFEVVAADSVVALIKLSAQPGKLAGGSVQPAPAQ